jgi:hypothetical membrane protein
MRLDPRRIGAVCGLVAPLAFLTLYGWAVTNDPDYVFFENYLSDLGVGAAAWAFNSAVIIAGALTLPFDLLAIRPALGGGVPASLAVAFTAVGSVFLVLVGVLTEDYGDAHYFVSVGFFMSMLMALLFHSWALGSSHAFGEVVTWLTWGVFATGAVLTVMGFNPQTETVAVLGIVLWGLAVSSSLLLRGPGTPSS